MVPEFLPPIRVENLRASAMLANEYYKVVGDVDEFAVELVILSDDIAGGRTMLGGRGDRRDGSHVSGIELSRYGY